MKSKVENPTKFSDFLFSQRIHDIADKKVLKDLIKIFEMQEAGKLSSTGADRLIEAIFETLAWQIHFFGGRE